MAYVHFKLAIPSADPVAINTAHIIAITEHLKKNTVIRLTAGADITVAEDMVTVFDEILAAESSEKNV